MRRKNNGIGRVPRGGRTRGTLDKEVVDLFSCSRPRHDGENAVVVFGVSKAGMTEMALAESGELSVVPAERFFAFDRTWNGCREISRRRRAFGHDRWPFADFGTQNRGDSRRFISRQGIRTEHSGRDGMVDQRKECLGVEASQTRKAAEPRHARVRLLRHRRVDFGIPRRKVREQVVPMLGDDRAQIRRECTRSGAIPYGAAFDEKRHTAFTDAVEDGG